MDDEGAAIELLDQNLKKTHVLSQRMTGILTHFDTRLNKLERSILPLHKGTESLTRLTTNIDTLLAHLTPSSISTLQQSASSDASYISSVSPTTQNIPLYTQNLSSLFKKVTTLQSSTLKSAEAGLVETSKQIEIGFGRLCNLAARQVEEGSRIAGMGANGLDWYLQNSQSPTSYLTTYATLTPLTTFLTNQLPRSSSHPTYSVTTDSFSTLIREYTAARSNFVRNILDSSIRSFGTGGDVPLKKLVEAIIQIGENEERLLRQLFPSTSTAGAAQKEKEVTIHSRNLTSILSPPIHLLFSTTIPSMLQSLKKELLSPAGSKTLYSLWESLNSAQGPYDSFFKAATAGAVGSEIRDVLLGGSGNVGGMKAVVLRSFPEWVGSASHFPPPNPPNQSPLPSLHSTTTRTVSYLLQLPPYINTITYFLNLLGDRKWLMGAAPGAADEGESIVEHFVGDVVRSLVNAIMGRVRSMKRGTGGIWALCNISYMREQLVLSSSFDLLPSSGEDLLNASFRKAKQLYLDDWTVAISALTAPSTSPKDAFSQFWDLLESLESAQRPFLNKLLEPDTRRRLGDEVVQMVTRGYGAAVTRNGGLNSKYIRQSPQELQVRLDALFR